MHQVGDRVPGATTLTHRVHGRLSTAVYTGISTSLRVSAKGLRAAAGAGLSPGIEESSRGRLVVAAVNGLVGDRLREEGSNLALDMGVRVDSRDLTLDRAGAAAAYPNANDTLVIFVHGLSENESYWNRAARPKREVPDQRSYGDRLEGEGGLRSTSGSTPASRSPRTASHWRPCSTGSSRRGPPAYAAPRWWATRWVA